MKYLKSLSLKELEKRAEEIGFLTPEEERELVEKFKKNGDKEAIEKLILSNFKLIMNFIKKYENLGVPIEDLFGEAVLGVIEAAKRYDPKKNTRFMSYAIWWIRQAIVNALSSQSGPIKLPPKIVNNIIKMLKTEREWKEKKGRMPTIEELAEELSISKKKLHRIEDFVDRGVSLDKPVGNDDTSTVESFLKEEQISPEDAIITQIMIENLKRAMKKLTKREFQILALRFGFATDKPKTLSEVGKIMGLSRERVRQIEKKGLEKLKKIMAGKSIEGSLN